MACPQVVNGEECLQIWRVAANIFSKQSQTANNSLGVGQGVNNSSP